MKSIVLLATIALSTIAHATTVSDIQSLQCRSISKDSVITVDIKDLDDSGKGFGIVKIYKQDMTLEKEEVFQFTLGAQKEALILSNQYYDMGYKIYPKAKLGIGNAFLMTGEMESEKETYPSICDLQKRPSIPNQK